MEQKLNIAKILKNKPRGTKLYSMIHGKCSFEAVTDEIFKINFCTSKFGLTQSGECTLIKFGNMYDGGECIIFPSKEMRDWEKFSWKKGDVLISSDGSIEVIFDKWYDDTYTSFYCKHYLNSEDKNKIVYYEEFLCTTARYSLEDKDTVQTYIKTIEERLGGKLNCETLEELKNTYKKLQEESNNLYNKIRALENQDRISKFTVGECYLDTRQDNLIKIVSIQGNYVYYICLDNLSICRENSCIFYIQGWKKITSEQFKNAYLAIMKDMRDPDLGDEIGSNWNRVYNSIVTSVNS